ncbi:MAG TPA: 50S ribosomal protein L9, partial [Verrucomicrobiae bacterium]|nr:50S ribosomal protein L9 [Verrucomicrobiae bacterium]
HNVVGLGAESDHVKVAAGYARNYLFPQGLAIPLTMANKRQIEALQKRRVDREAKELHTMTELASTLSKLTLVIHMRTGEDGKLFGSVTSGTIADELRHQYDAQVDKRKIHLQQPIKNLGEHEIPLHLHHDVNCTLKVRVESSTPLSPEVQAAIAAQAVAQKREKEAPKAEAKSGKEGGPRGRTPGKGEHKGEGKAPRGEAKEAKTEKPAKAEKAERAEKSGEKKAKAAKAE